jgi:hypothetical protein
MDIVDEVKAIFDEKNNLIKQLRGVIDSLLAANKDLQMWYNSSREDAAQLREALNADNQTIRLHLGEMTQQEMRTVKAAFAWVLSRAALKESE